MTIAALFLSADAVLAAPVPRRGAFAFQYAPSLTPEQLAWYSRFSVLVTHDPLPADQARALRAAGTRLLFYEWSVAFYEAHATPWQRQLFGARNSLLHEDPLYGGVGSASSPAWYFDVAHPDFATNRSTELARRLEETGYDGVFFDTTRFESVHPEARREFERRHPATSYDEAFSRFLAVLRERIGPRILFTNQGYRSPEHHLPHARWDLTESLITRNVDGHAELRPWNDSRDPWNSILFVMRTMIEPLVARYPHTRFAHLNYVDGHDANTIAVAIAVAQIFGGEAYVSAPEIEHEQHNLYFRDPGTPVAARVEWPNGNGTHRFFDRGLIVVSDGTSEARIETGGRQLRNHLTGELACGGTVTIPTSPTTRAWFFDDTTVCTANERIDSLPGS